MDEIPHTYHGTVNRIDDLSKHCLEQFTNHWKCLDNHNHQLYQCRPFEWKLNKCAYENLVRVPSPLPNLDHGS